MNTLGLIIQREYSSRVTKKTFILFTIFMPILFLALAFVPLWLSTIKDSEIKKIVVIDHTGIYAPEFKSTDNYRFEIVGKAEESANYTPKLGKDFFAILQITDDLSKKPQHVFLISEKQVPMSLLKNIEKVLSEKVTRQRLDELSASGNVDAQTIVKVRHIIESDANVTVSTLRLNKEGETFASSSMLSSIVGIVFTLLIYIFLMSYGGMVMQAVLEEKRSRIIEVMVSSVKPVNLLIGKIIGIGLVGLTQLFIWALLIGSLTMILGILPVFSNDAATSSQLMSNSMQQVNMPEIVAMFQTINWLEIILYFIVFFIGGYVLYASIFAMIGASVDNEQDTQQFMMPITIILLFAFYAGFYSIENPDGPLAFWCSFIPFTSPVVMMVRIPFGIPVWEKILSVIILYGSFVVISIFSAKIYRVGILMYGKKPTVKEIIKWAKYK